MIEKTITTRIKNRIDTEDNWLSNNPVLLPGEVAYSIIDGEKKCKVGDGTTTYTNLSFINDPNKSTTIRDWTNDIEPVNINDPYKFYEKDFINHIIPEPNWHDDGKIYLYIDFSLTPGMTPEISLKLGQGTSNSFQIDWGDGSNPEISKAADYYYQYETTWSTHVYDTSTTKKFEIKLTNLKNASVTFGFSTVSPIRLAGYYACYALELGSDFAYGYYMGGSGVNIGQGTITSMAIRYLFLGNVVWYGARYCELLSLIRNPYNKATAIEKMAGNSGGNRSLIKPYKIHNTPSSIYQLFQNNNSMLYADLSYMNTSAVPSFGYVFDGCTSLKTANVSGFNCTSATETTCMFRNTYCLEELEIRGWDTSHITTMNNTFENSRLPSFNAPNWNTQSLSSTNSMFNGWRGRVCNMDNWDWSSVKTMAGMFQNSTVEVINTDMSNTTACTGFGSMFQGASRLQSIDFEINTSAAVITSNMYNGCTSLKKIPDTISFECATAAANFSNTFYNLSALSAYPTHMVCPNKAWSYTISFAQSSAVNGDSLATFSGNDIIGGLAYYINDVTNASYTRTLQLHTRIKNKFTSAKQTAIANMFTSKGWTLAW